jgi:hypothetical protein
MPSHIWDDKCNDLLMMPYVEGTRFKQLEKWLACNYQTLKFGKKSREGYGVKGWGFIRPTRRNPGFLSKHYPWYA